MKKRSFGLIVILVAIIGSIFILAPGAFAATSKDGWKNTFASYCGANYTNLGPCSSPTGPRLFQILQNNDAASSNPGEYCGATCSSNFFSTVPPATMQTTPDDTIAVSNALSDSATLSVYLYSSQRDNDPANYPTTRSNALIGQDTYELFVADRTGGNFSYTRKQTAAYPSGKASGYVDNGAGQCYADGAQTTPIAQGTELMNKDIVLQRPAINGTAGRGDLYPGKYGGSRVEIANDGVAVQFNVGWLRAQAAAYAQDPTKQYVPVFEGLYFHGAGPANQSGCVDIKLNAKAIKLVAAGNIYPQLSTMSVGESAIAGADSTPVQSMMINNDAFVYQVPSDAAVYDFTVSSVNAARVTSRFSDSNSTYIWSAGTNSVDNLCSILPDLFSGGVMRGVGGCSKVEGLYSNDTYQVGTTVLDGAGKSLKTSDKPAGTIMCRVIVVNNFNGDNDGTTNLRAGTPACFVIGKRPKIQIWGGDLRVGGDVDVSQSLSNGNYYGSWDEYGSFIAKINRNNAFASGAALGGPNGASSNDPVQLNRLTFANKTSDGGYGEFDNPTLVYPASQSAVYSNIVSNALQIPNGGAFRSNIGGLSGFYTVNGDATVSASSIPAGRTIVIQASGTVTVTGNITYPGNFRSISDIPQVIIVAKAINIKDTVTHIDAWLIAGVSGGNTGSINTCYNVQDLTTSTCASPLVINGPVVSDTAKFRRTAGANDANTAGDPAETLNLRADSYLWEYNLASKHVVPTTVQVTQLPPRY